MRDAMANEPADFKSTVEAALDKTRAAAQQVAEHRAQRQEDPYLQHEGKEYAFQGSCHYPYRQCRRRAPYGLVVAEYPLSAQLPSEVQRSSSAKQHWSAVGCIGWTYVDYGKYDQVV